MFSLLRMTLTDEELHAKAIAGDAHAARQLVTRLSPKAYGLALRLMGHPNEAEDMVQESFIKLFQGRGFEGRSKLGTFFYSIVSNTCIDALRKQHKQLFEADDYEVEQVSSHEEPSAILSKRQDLGQMQYWISSLSPRQRVAIAMWVYQDANLLQIANALNLEVNAANQLLHRAKTALKLKLKGIDHESA